MKKSFAKRALALVLSTIMLASCWVFTAPTTAVAAGASEYAYRIEHTDANPVYHVEIDMHILDAGNGFNRVFKGTQTGNPNGGIWDDKNYKDMGGIVIWYKDNNGTAASEKDYSIDFSPTNAKIAYYHSDGSQVTNNTMFPDSGSGSRDNWDDKYYTLCLDLSGFPTAYAVYNNNDHMKLDWFTWKPDTWTDFEITQIRVSAYDSSVDVTSEAYDSYRPIFTGNIRSASTDGANCSRYYIQQDGTVSIWRPNEFGSNFEGNTDNNWVHFSDFADGQDAMKKGGSFNAAYSKSWDMPCPQLPDYNYTRLSDENNYYPAPEHAVLTEPYVFGKDQYGAQLAGTVTSSFVCLGEKYYDGSTLQNASFGEPSYAFNNQTAEITPLKANGYQYHQFSIRPQTEWVIGGQYINVNGATNGMYYGNTKTALMNYTPQTVTWQHYTDNSAGNTGTLQQPTTEVFYGDTPAARTDLPTAYYDNTSHHSGGSFTTGPVTEDTTYTMQYAVNEEHTISYSELSNTDEEYHSKHLATCTAGCGFTEKVDHIYGATSFVFADDGKSATVSRQCTVNGCNHIQTGSVSLAGGGITSVVKTAATCTAVGTTTYTATSPYGDGKTATKDVADIPATGHHLADNPIMYSDAEGHYYKCKDCEVFIKSDLSEGKHAHTPQAAQQENVVPATCTQAGSYNSVVRCSEEACNWAISSTPHTIPALGHDWGAYDTTNATNHTRVCSRDSSHVDTGAHAFSNWSKNVPQDETLVEKMKKDYDPSAQCFRYCNVCYRIEYSNHNYVGTETAAATCEGTGVKTYTCSICNDSYTETIPAKGHDYEEETYQPVDAHAGFEYFECSACHKLWQAAYNGSTYVPDKTKSEYAPDALSQLVEAVESDPTNTSIVPASTFNNFLDETIPVGGGDYYNYSERGSGLRLMRTDTGAVDESFNPDLTTRQDMRFSGAATLPTGVSISVNPSYYNYSEEQLKEAHVDNCLVDFGYIYTQDDYMIKEGGFDALTIENTDTEEHPGTKFARMSVASNNDANGTYNPTEHNWTGVTYHSGDRQLTFNLVIRIKAKNWSYFYSCRPYLRYMYHGHLYTVYDEVAFGPTYSCAMVYYVAEDLVRAHDPLTEYATRKIIDNYDYLPKGDLK